MEEGREGGAIRARHFSSLGGKNGYKAANDKVKILMTTERTTVMSAIMSDMALSGYIKHS